jgi:hypothetical protein
MAQPWQAAATLQPPCSTPSGVPRHSTRRSLPELHRLLSVSCNYLQPLRTSSSECIVATLVCRSSSSLRRVDGTLNLLS